VSDNAATAGPSTSEAVEELLRQLVDARFVLMARDGAVTRWSRPAEELFGWPGARMLGRPLVETLSLGIDVPETGGRVSATARRKDGHELEVALTFVPVRMSQSLEFNGFLEALEIAAPRGNALGQLQRSHRTVVEWIAAAIAGQAEIEEGGLAAGTIVAFRPLEEPPPPAPDPADEPDTPAHPEDFDERLQRLEDAGAGLGSELGDTRRVLEEMSARVEGLRSELERTRAEGEEQAREEHERLRAELERTREQVGALEEQTGLERMLTGAAERLDVVERALAEEHERIAAMERARDEQPGWLEAIEHAHGEARVRLEAELTEARSRIELLEGAGSQERERLERERAEGERRLQGELEELRARVTDLADDAGRARRLGAELEETRRLVESLGDRIEEVKVEAVGDEEARRLLGDLREELTSLRSGALENAVDAAELRALAERADEAAVSSRDAHSAIERLTGRAEEAADAARSHSSNAYDAAGAAEARAMRAEEAIQAVEAAAGRAHDTAQEIGRHAQAAEQAAGHAGEEAARAQDAAARAETQAGRAEDQVSAVDGRMAHMAEAAHQAEFRAEQAEEAAAAAAEAAVLARRSAEEASSQEDRDPRRPLFGRKRDTEPAREKLPGFDDVPDPMATIGMDGRFRELNQAFTDLVGYSEEDFRSASWPPVMDRANLPKHREQMKRLLAGEIDSAEVNTGYVHAQGLLVPVIGTISLLSADGRPDRFLLSAKS
jgi:PAS domain S-box-containing protein